MQSQWLWLHFGHYDCSCDTLFYDGFNNNYMDVKPQLQPESFLKVFLWIRRIEKMMWRMTKLLPGNTTEFHLKRPAGIFWWLCNTWSMVGYLFTSFDLKNHLNTYISRISGQPFIQLSVFMSYYFRDGLSAKHTSWRKLYFFTIQIYLQLIFYHWFDLYTFEWFAANYFKVSSTSAVIKRSNSALTHSVAAPTSFFSTLIWRCESATMIFK